MNLILFDDPEARSNLLPLTFTRPVSLMRVGILTIVEKWEHYLNLTGSFLTDKYLSGKFSIKNTHDNILINGAVCPSEDLLKAVKGLEKGQALFNEGKLIAGRTSGKISTAYPFLHTWKQQTDYAGKITVVDRLWKIFEENDEQLRLDFNLLTRNRKSAPIEDPYTMTYGNEQIFLEEGVSIKAAIINAEGGPVYIGKNVLIQEGAILRGPVAICEGSHVNMNAKIRPATTIGPYSRAGGEINNVVIFGYSNKGHEGFLGNAVIGEWCNIGADSNNSNLKNNYAEVKLWDYTSRRFVNTGLQFCGLIMGDHTKCGINTMFNTGTVIGVGANIFGSGFPRNFIPSFSWGGPSGFSSFRLSKFYEIAERVMERRHIALTDEDRKILSYIFEATREFRKY